MNQPPTTGVNRDWHTEFYLKNIRRYRLRLRLVRKQRLVLTFFVTILAIILFGGSAGYGAHGMDGFLPAIKAGISCYLIGAIFLGWRRSFVLGLAMSCSMGLIGDDPSYLPSSYDLMGLMKFPFLGFCLGLILGFSFGLVTQSSGFRKHLNFLRERMGYTNSDFVTIPGGIFLFVMIAYAISAIGRMPSIWLALYIGFVVAVIYVATPLSVAFGISPGVLLGNIVRSKVEPGLLSFSDLAPYLRAMVVPLVGFVFGYMLIIFAFANFFRAAWRADQCCSFANLPPEPSFGTFFYFSLVTISTLGYGDVSPASSLTMTLVGIEVMLGIGWITVVFAAVLAHLQPRFVEIANSRKRSVRH